MCNSGGDWTLLGALVPRKGLSIYLLKNYCIKLVRSKYCKKETQKENFLYFRWLRCSRKGSSHTTHRHGSITKVALTGNVPSETSKLLVSNDIYGRQVVSPYDQVHFFFLSLYLF